MPKKYYITEDVYNMLINDGYTPETLSIKIKLNIKINSPDTNRFTKMGSVTYKKLLKKYTAWELYLRRDGYINSPITDKPIKVFGSTFKKLLNTYSLNTLLRLERVSWGNHEAENSLISTIPNEEGEKEEKVEEKKEKIIEKNEKKNEKKEIIKDEQFIIEKNVKNIKNNRKIGKLDKIVSKAAVDKCIKDENLVIIYASGINNEYFAYEDRNDDGEKDFEYDKLYKCFHASAGIFKNGKLLCIYDTTEHHIGMTNIEYKVNYKLWDIVKTQEEYEKFLLDYNADESTKMTDYVFEGVDLRTLYNILQTKYTDNVSKKKVLEVLQERYNKAQNCTTYANIVKHHMWYLTQLTVYGIIPNSNWMVNVDLIDQKGDRNYETFEDVIAKKTQFLSDIKTYQEKLVTYVEQL
jgi:hypothetical protein